MTLLNQSASSDVKPSFISPGRIQIDWRFLLIAPLIVAILYGSFTTPNFFTAMNFAIIIRAAAIVGIMAIGLTYVTIAGHFFLLSITEIAAISSVTFALLSGTDLSFIAVVLITISLAAILGAIQGALIGFGGNPIIVTLAFGSIIMGVASYASDASMLQIKMNPFYNWIGAGLSFGIPNITWLFILTLVIGDVVLRYSTFGRRVYLTGASKKTSHAVGNKDAFLAVAVCTIAAVAGGIVGLVFSAQMEMGYVNHFSGAMGASGSLTLNAIAAVMVGGTAIAGGAGSALRSGLGAVFIAYIDNMMVLRDFDNGPRVLVVGLIILVSVVMYGAFRKGIR